ncbi:MAG: YggS family pyridoxal phosphate-dependent enzyme, partial [Oscillospiraceae bacterium]|nr:YggS family pyridoxal phosphate-dependent enzyme [Oscillospiraceae bacterium]
MSIAENLRTINAQIATAAKAAGRAPEDILLVAATKTQSAGRVREAIAAGVRACGENRVQELTAKSEESAYDGASLHFIGHLQRNKLNKVVGKVDLLESVDSEELLSLVNQQAEKLGIVQDILLEINIAGEENKFGISATRLPALSALALSLPHVRLRGLMAIPPIQTVPGGNRQFFAQMRQLFVDMKEKAYHNNDILYLSM